MALAVATKRRRAKDDGRLFEEKAAEMGEMIAAMRKRADELAALGSPEARERARVIRWRATREENWIVTFRRFMAECPDD
jgi:hypothetical protein